MRVLFRAACIYTKEVPVIYTAAAFDTAAGVPAFCCSNVVFFLPSAEFLKGAYSVRSCSNRLAPCCAAQRLAPQFPGSEWVTAAAALAQYGLRNFDEAQELYEDLLERDPHRIEVISLCLSSLQAAFLIYCMGILQCKNPHFSEVTCQHAHAPLLSGVAL